MLVAGIISLAWPAPAAAAVSMRFSQDRILIIPKTGHDAALANQHTTERVKIRKKFPALGNIHVIEVPKGANPQALVERYRRSGHVETADLDYMGWHPAATPNDPSFLSGVQWHLNNTGWTPGADIDASGAWDILNSASNIIVAVIDTGIRPTHQDLAPNLWTNPGEIPGNNIDDDGNGYTNDIHGINVLPGANPTNIIDDHGHGSHVSGILGAAGNNGLGICGVAWKVQIMPVKIYSPSPAPESSDSDVVEALDYAVAKGAKVINFSFVSTNSTDTLSNGFWSVQNADIIVCAAAGNSGTDNDNPLTPIYPANYKMSNLVAVAATDSTDTLWSFSNHGGTKVHLAAPGAGIYSTFNQYDSGYGYLSGTSMATPMVSGAAALLRARFPNESAPQIIQRILNSVDVLPSLIGKCVTSGRLNLRRAIDSSYTVTNAPYAWVSTNGMTLTTFASGDGVNGLFDLPFTFPFFGRDHTQIWVSANGIVGVTSNGLSTAGNANIPATNTPNAIYPYWDDLNPLGAGASVWVGTAGVAPNRKAVVSWVSVPHMTNAMTVFTFQAVLHESGQVAFQYANLNPGATALTNAKSATVGIEDPTGLFGTRYTTNGVPYQITNNQAIVFTRPVVNHRAPGLRIESGPEAGRSQLTLSGEPAQPGAVIFSTNLVSWSMVYSNILPASGLATYSQTNSAPQKFFRAISGPFLP